MQKADRDSWDVAKQPGLDAASPRPSFGSSKTSGPCGAGLRGSPLTPAFRVDVSEVGTAAADFSQGKRDRRGLNETVAVARHTTAARRVAVTVRAEKLPQMSCLCRNDAKVFPEETDGIQYVLLLF